MFVSVQYVHLVHQVATGHEMGFEMQPSWDLYCTLVLNHE